MFDFLRKKGKYKPRMFEDEDRELSLEIRRTNAQLKKMQMEKEIELQRLELELERTRLMNEIRELKGDDDGFNAESMLMQLLTPMLTKTQNQISAGIDTSKGNIPPQPTTLHLSDEQIYEILENLDKRYLKVAKKMPDDQLGSFIKGQMPNLDVDTIERAILIIKDR